MDTNRNTNVRVRLTLPGESAHADVPKVHQYRSLESAGVRLEDNRYVLATDDDGRIVGVVSRDRILNRLKSANDAERTRWSAMPVGALLNVAFTETAEPAARFTDNLEGVAIVEDGGLVGLAIGDDVFLSWQRLEPLLTVATSDPLTGLMNRLSYDRRLLEEWQRAMRTKVSVGVMVVDLNRFKPINDNFGHQAGDHVLQGIASLLEHSLRSYDILARYGGDEFVALCVGCRAGEIHIPIERINQRLATSKFCFEGTPLDVSVAIGAAVRHSGFADSDPQALFRAADDCMYLAKNSGPTGAFVVEFGEGYSEVPTPIQTEHCHEIQL